MDHGFRLLTKCSKHKAYICKDTVCVREREQMICEAPLPSGYLQGVDPGDDSEFLDKHKKMWPTYHPELKKD